MNVGDRPSLDSIGTKHGTDKSSIHHDYLRFYEPFFQDFREQDLKILEIGILDGASLYVWEEYFPRARIVGCDINPVTKQFERGRINIEVLDQSNIQDLTEVAIKYGRFDLIIEDGSHMWEHQITSLRTLFPFLSERNGIYIVEDLQTNFGSLADSYKGVASRSCMEFLKDWLDLHVGDDQLPTDSVEDAFLRTYARAVDTFAFYRRACLIKKKAPTPRQSLNVGLPLKRDSADQGTGVRLLAHVSGFGDVYGLEGFVNLGIDHPIQGLRVDLGDDPIEIRVRYSDRSWSEWAGCGHFVGTRGLSKLLTGVTVRLRKEIRTRYSLVVLGRFDDADNPVEVAEGQDCVSLRDEPLCGIQIVLCER